MPHLSLEYSPGLDRIADPDAICRAAHGAMVEAGIFPLAGIRVRAHKADHAIVADGHPDNNFLAMTLSVGSGRSTEQLHAAGEQIFKAVQAELAAPLATPHFALSLEIRIINPDLSWKDTPIHTRLTGKT